MSNKKNSPIVETTVVKKDNVITDHTDAQNRSQHSDEDNSPHYASIAEFKKATDIIDADGNLVDDDSEESQAQKKAKLREDLITESNELKEADDLDIFATTAAADTNADETEGKDSTEKSSNDKKGNNERSNTDEKDTKANSKNNADKEKDNQKTDDKSTNDKKDKEFDTTVAAKPRSTPKKKKNSTTKLISGQHRVAILGGNRIPFARSNGPYADASNIDMLTAALNGLIERYNLQDERMGEVVAGAVMKLSRDINLTREAALNTALDPHTPTYDITQACGTGLQATFASANKIALGIIDSAITGGVDTTSDAPIAIGDGLRKVLLKLGAAKNMKQRLQALTSFDPKDLVDSPQNGEPRTGLSMGDHQAITALEWNISREDQDELAFNSHKNLARAYDEGFFDDLITPYKGLTRDNNLRPDSTLEKLGKLKPVFGKNNANPTMTAANSTPLTDGASCVLLANDEWAQARGLKPLAYIVHQETAAVDFIGKAGDKEGLLMAPAYAVPRMLERAGLSLQDFDFYEIHEAFASQVLSTLSAWEDENFCTERLGLDSPLGSIDRSKLNVNGSSLAAGHPFAATGGRILATAAKLLDQKGSGRALISICAAGGQGVTCILEK
ncbi:acetyl-CoA C-acetyltransferase [Psychrobacter sp. CAL346-MNA-CIBAN-0220]|uniref:acetyl-CoA C-acetyltransferase n=1 Tax=Psychrobacter sp. CAL346-MNA-CIBAN-0220 TaxID=3140457 RepID=UPI0033240DE2